MITVKMAVATEDAFPFSLGATASFQKWQLSWSLLEEQIRWMLQSCFSAGLGEVTQASFSSGLL